MSDKKYSLRNEIEMRELVDLQAERNKKLQERCDRYEKALIEIQQLKRRDTTNLVMINKLHTIAKDALAAIGENHD